MKKSFGAYKAWLLLLMLLLAVGVALMTVGLLQGPPRLLPQRGGTVSHAPICNSIQNMG